MSDLIRYGLKWSGPKNFVAKEMKNGYWTPWHLADSKIKKLEARLEAEENKAAARHQFSSKRIHELDATLKEREDLIFRLVSEKAEREGNE